MSSSSHSDGIPRHDVLEAAGKPAGDNDLLIVAHARAAGAIVTANTDEFKRIRGLKGELAVLALIAPPHTRGRQSAAQVHGRSSVTSA
jgi:hypothetical protein